MIGRATKTQLPHDERSIELPIRQREGFFRSRAANWQLYLLLLIPLLYFVIFKYAPMYGAQIAFKNFNASAGILGSPWVGFKHFTRFFQSHQFVRVLRNTIGISVFQLVAGFPIPIILALALNNCEFPRFKRITQMTTYAPHFISVVVMVGIILQFLSPRFGIVNALLGLVGFEPVSFMGEPALFKSIYVFSDIWQNAGWGTIIYLAALAGIDPTMHEAAIVDGASKLQRNIHIDIPGILPTAIILLILNTGQIMNVGFQKVFLMQNALNLQSSEVITTYVYKLGIASSIPNYSYASAIGLFNSVVNLVLIVTVNSIAKRTGENSLW